MDWGGLQKEWIPKLKVWAEMDPKLRVKGDCKQEDGVSGALIGWRSRGDMLCKI